jgi:CopG antitoxin of type II toxin-antitoxin system
MNKKLKAIPKFRSEAKERRFWQTHDSSDYIDWTKAARARFPNSQAVNDCDLATPASDASRTMPLMSGPLTSSSTRTAVAPACGCKNGTKRKVRRGGGTASARMHALETLVPFGLLFLALQWPIKEIS